MKKKDGMGRIIIDPEVMVGKPVIKGTRLTVQHILGLLAQGMTVQEIIQEYTMLTPEDVFACIIFARDALENTTFVPLSTQ